MSVITAAQFLPFDSGEPRLHQSVSPTIHSHGLPCDLPPLGQPAISVRALLFFHTPAPTALEMPMPMPTAAPTMITAMRIFTDKVCVLLRLPNGLHRVACCMHRFFVPFGLPGLPDPLLGRGTSDEEKVCDPASRSCS
jgi:hypothetical protein